MFKFDPKNWDDVLSRALDIIQEHKKRMLSLQNALDIDLDGTPHVIFRELMIPWGWQSLPSETFKGEGTFNMLDRNNNKAVLYYEIKGGSSMVKHSVDVDFTLHVCYGHVICGISKDEKKTGEVGFANANTLHQLNFPVDTGMIITFDLS